MDHGVFVIPKCCKRMVYHITMCDYLSCWIHQCLVRKIESTSNWNFSSKNFLTKKLALAWFQLRHRARRDQYLRKQRLTSFSLEIKLVKWVCRDCRVQSKGVKHCWFKNTALTKRWSVRRWQEFWTVVVQNANWVIGLILKLQPIIMFSLELYKRAASQVKFEQSQPGAMVTAAMFITRGRQITTNQSSHKIIRRQSGSLFGIYSYSSALVPPSYII